MKIMMTKGRPHIKTIQELELYERQVRMRLKETESEIRVRVKQVPEELVSAALIKFIAIVIEGKAIKTLAGLLKKVSKSTFLKLFGDQES